MLVPHDMAFDDFLEEAFDSFDFDFDHLYVYIILLFIFIHLDYL